MSSESKSNLTNPDIWIRLLYMIVFGLLLAVARLVILAVAVIQFLLVLLTDNDNPNLRNLGWSTAKWYFQALLFVTFNSESKPFPFADWPEADPLSETDDSAGPSVDVDAASAAAESEAIEVPVLSDTVAEPAPEKKSGSAAGTGTGNEDTGEKGMGEKGTDSERKAEDDTKN